jgi:hypothetical protein
MALATFVRILFVATIAFGACRSAPVQHGQAHEDDHYHRPATQPASQPAVSVPSVFDGPPENGTRARCPVSGDVFVVDAKTVRAEHNGKYVALCCAGCVDEFEANPAKYLSK